MNIDARELNNNTSIDGDICIIGAGAAGISMALDWDKTKYKVILLEGGGFEYDAKLQELYKGNILGHKYLALDAIRSHQFGGTTSLWGGLCSPYDEIDFIKREWVEHSGWPISLNDLDPYYKKTKDILDLHSHEYSLKYWQKTNANFINLKLDNDVVYEKMWQFSPPTRFGSKYKDEIINSNNINLYTYANVTDIILNSDNTSIKEVIIQNHAKKKHKVRAKYYVLACGAIQNARLLLNSNKQVTGGLGNENDLVGRYFMEHIEVKSSELWLGKKYPMDLYLLQSGKTKARAELAITMKVQEKYKILNGTASLRPLSLARHSTTINDKWRKGNPRLNEKEMSFRERLQKKFMRVKEEFVKKIDQAYLLHTRIEQAPNPNSRIILDKEKDALGMYRANLNWELTAIDRISIRKLHEIIGQQVGISEIGRIKLLDFLEDENDESWPEYMSGGFHHMGTTRMSDNPKKGVVDRNCKIHSINNLYIAGSSCFATSGAANPTFTIVALSLRLSEHLKSKFNNMTN